MQTSQRGYRQLDRHRYLLLGSTTTQLKKKKIYDSMVSGQSSFQILFLNE